MAVLVNIEKVRLFILGHVYFINSGEEAILSDVSHPLCGEYGGYLEDRLHVLTDPPYLPVKLC